MKRFLLYGSNMAVFIVLVCAIVVGLNMLSLNHHKRIDLTDEGLHSLSAQTIKVLASLQNDLEVLAFIVQEDRRDVIDILDRYTYITNKFSYTIVDPDKEPSLTQKYGITEYHRFVVEAKNGGRETIKTLDENTLTNAILKANSFDEKVIYMLEGHDERSITRKSAKPRDWTKAKAALISAGYSVKSLNWFTTGKLPEDADLLIIPGPMKDYQPEEIEMLRDYANNGLAMMIACDGANLVNLERFLLEFGFRFNGDVVVDPLSQQLGFKWLLAVTPNYGKHPISIELGEVSMFWVARSINILLENKRKARIISLAMTHKDSWGELDLDSVNDGAPTFDAKHDLPGPRTIIGAAEYEVGPSKEALQIGENSRKGRIVVSGDADFAANSYLDMAGNKDLFLNSVGWLLEEENRLSIRARKSGFDPIFFTGNQLNAIFVAVVLVAPGIALLIGIVVSVRRRRD